MQREYVLRYSTRGVLRFELRFSDGTTQQSSSLERCWYLDVICVISRTE